MDGCSEENLKDIFLLFEQCLVTRAGLFQTIILDDFGIELQHVFHGKRMFPWVCFPSQDAIVTSGDLGSPVWPICFFILVATIAFWVGFRTPMYQLKQIHASVLGYTIQE